MSQEEQLSVAVLELKTKCEAKLIGAETLLGEINARLNTPAHLRDAAQILDKVQRTLLDADMVKYLTTFPEKIATFNSVNMEFTGLRVKISHMVGQHDGQTFARTMHAGYGGLPYGWHPNAHGPGSGAARHLGRRFEQVIPPAPDRTALDRLQSVERLANQIANEPGNCNGPEEAKEELRRTLKELVSDSFLNPWSFSVSDRERWRMVIEKCVHALVVITDHHATTSTIISMSEKQAEKVPAPAQTRSIYSLETVVKRCQNFLERVSIDRLTDLRATDSLTTLGPDVRMLLLDELATLADGNLLQLLTEQRYYTENQLDHATDFTQLREDLEQAALQIQDSKLILIYNLAVHCK